MARVESVEPGARPIPGPLPPRIPSPIPLPPGPLNPIDEQYTYQTYSPAAGGVSSSYAPSGGVVNWSLGPDPNGYYWVDDGTPNGYWWNPSDGTEWRAPSTAAPVAPGTPITYAPTVYGALPPAQQATRDAQLEAALGGKLTGWDTVPSTPENMAAYDLAYANAVGGAERAFDEAVGPAERTLADVYAEAERTGDWSTVPGAYAAYESAFNAYKPTPIEISPWALPVPPASPGYAPPTPETMAAYDQAYANQLLQARTNPVGMDWTMAAQEGELNMPRSYNLYEGESYRPLPRDWSLASQEGALELPGTVRTSLDDPRFIDPGVPHVLDESGRWISQQPSGPAPNLFGTVLPEPWIRPAARYVSNAARAIPGFGLAAEAANLGWRLNPLVGGQYKERPLSEQVVEQFIRNTTSPVGLATLPIAMSPAGLAANITGELGAAAAQVGTRGVGAPGWVQGVAALGGGLAGGLAIPGGAVGGGLRRTAGDVAEDTFDFGPRALGLDPNSGTMRPSWTLTGDDLRRGIYVALGDDVPTGGWDEVLSPPPAAVAPPVPRVPQPVGSVVAEAPAPPVSLADEAAATPPVPVRPRASGAVLADTRTPPGVTVDAVVTRKRGRATLEAQVLVDGQDAGLARRTASNERFEALYRNPDGALVPVPKDASGAAYTGTLAQVKKAVANAYRAGGKLVVDEPVTPRAPRAAAAPPPAAAAPSAPPPAAAVAEEAATPARTAALPPVRAGRWMVYFDDEADLIAYRAGARNLSSGRNVNYNATALEAYQRLKAMFPGETREQLSARIDRVRQAVTDAPKTGENAGSAWNFDVKRIPPVLREPEVVAPLRTAPVGGKGAPIVAPQAILNPATGEVAEDAFVDAVSARVGAEVVADPKRFTRVAAADKAREAARVAKSPVQKNQAVYYKGAVYQVDGIQTRTRTVSLKMPDQSPLPRGVPAKVPWDELDMAGPPVREMSIRQMMRELTPTGRVPSTTRASLHMKEAAWEEALLKGKELSLDQMEKIRAARVWLQEQVEQVRKAADDTRAKEMLDTPEARQVADEVVAPAPKDIAVEGSPANIRAEKAALGQASPVETVIHEAEVAAVQRLVADEAGVPPVPSTTLRGLVEGQEQARRASRTGRALGTAKVAATIPVFGLRNLVLAGDMLVGRQLFTTLAAGHPKEFLTGYARQWRALLATPTQRRRMWAGVEAYAEQNPHVPLLRKGVNMNLGEELFIGRLWHNLPILGQIEQANALALNAARISLNEKLTKIAVATIPADRLEDALRAQGHFIGVITGRGYGTFLDRHADLLNATAFISSRWTASRFQFWGLFLPPPVARSAFGQKWGLGSEEWFIWRQQMKRVTAATAVATGIYSMLEFTPGVEIEKDPRSSKFGQFKVGGRWYDFMGGLEEPARLFARMALNEGKSERGSFFPIVEGKGGRWGAPIRAAVDYVTGRMPPASRLIAEQAGLLDPWAERPGDIKWSWNVAGLEFEAKRYIPLSVQQMWTTWNDVAKGERGALGALIDSVSLFHGFGVTEPSAIAKWESDIFSDRKSVALLDKPEFKIDRDKPLSKDNLNRAGWEYIRNNPDAFGEKPPSMIREFRETAETAEMMRAGRRAFQEGDDAALKAGSKTARDWRIERSAARQQLASDIGALYGEFPPSDPNDPDVIERYFAAIDANKHGEPGKEVIDWEAVEEWEARLSPEDQRKIRAYFDEKAKQGTEMEQRYYDDMNRIEAAGYWDLRDQYFQEWKKGKPEAERYATYQDWRAAVIEEKIEQYMAEQAVPRYVAAEMAVKEGVGDEFLDGFKAEVLYNWVIKNPEEAKALRDWGYYTPDKEAQGILLGDPSAAQEVMSTAALSKEMKAIPAWDGWQTRAWQTWAETNMPGGEVYVSLEEYRKQETANRIKAEETRLGRKLTAPEAAAVSKAVTDATGRYTSDSKADAATSIRYIGSDGKWTTGYLSYAALDQVKAIKAAYDANPEAVKAARAAGLPGLRDSDLSIKEKAWLAQNGVVLD